MIHIVSKANDNQLKALILVCWGSTIIAETNKGQGIGGPIHYCKIIDFSVLYFFTGYPESSGMYYRISWKPCVGFYNGLSYPV
jgi:hypothetical protein